MRELLDFTGRRIRLTAERWSPIQEHPEMREQENRIAETLREPDGVILSRRAPSVILYHEFFRFQMPPDRGDIRVVHLCRRSGRSPHSSHNPPIPNSTPASVTCWFANANSASITHTNPVICQTSR